MYMLAPLAVIAVGVLLLGWRPSASTNAHVRIQMCLVCLCPLITAVEKKSGAVLTSSSGSKKC